MRTIKVQNLWAVDYVLSCQAISVLAKHEISTPVSSFKDKLELGAYYLMAFSAPWQNNDLIIEGMYQYKNMYLGVDDPRIGLKTHRQCVTELGTNGFWNHKKSWLVTPPDRLFVLKKFGE